MRVPAAPTQFHLQATPRRYVMPASEKIQGPASYFPSIEKKYGQPIEHWLQVLRSAGDLKHMELVKLLKTDHGLGHGHANALVAHHLASGALVELVADTPLDVALHWQFTRLAAKALAPLTAAFRQTAALWLVPPD